MDGSEYRAELIDPALHGGRERLTMLRADSRVCWFDSLASQWRDFLDATKFRQPGGTALPEIDTTRGMYAYYPWSRRVVALLPEREFVELRTIRNQLKITPREQRTLATKTIGVVGLSVGQSVALTLAMERTCSELRLADFDAIDLSNLNRIRCGVHHLGINKAVVAAREIAELDPYLNVSCHVRGYTAECEAEFLDGLDLLVEECDSIDVKVAARNAARMRGIPVIMNTSDRGMTDIERFDLDAGRPLFHGNARLPESLADLTVAEKMPLVMDILGVDNLSTRLRASMLEIGSSIATWPQLAADVTLGGALVTSVARRLLLGENVASGRYFSDIDSIGRGETKAGRIGGAHDDVDL